MSDVEPTRRLRAGDADRDALLQTLHDAHAAGRLSVSDLSERQDAALRAVYLDELPPLVTDLPEGAAWGAPSAMPVRGAANLPAASLEGPTWTATVLSGKRIDLRPGQTVRNVAILGGDEIHLREALAPGVTLTVELHTLLAGHTLHVPAGVRVVDETHGFIGGNSVRKKAQGDGSNGVLVLRGWQILGGHTVKLEQDS